MRILVLLVVILLIGMVFAIPAGQKHHGKPTPTPSPTPVPTPTPPPTPTPKPTVTPVPTPIPQVTLAWDASAGATGYRLWLGFGPGEETQPINVGDVLQWTLQLTSGTTYYFVVTAYNSSGESLPSDEVSYTTPP